MKHLISILILILMTLGSFAQCPDSDKLKFGGTFATRYGCYDPKTSSIQYYSYDIDTTEYCCHISKIQKYADFILKKSEDYIKQRAGSRFLEKLVFQDIMVIYHDYSIIPDYYDRIYNLDSCGKISYWLTYKYFSDTSIEYLFGIEFDSEGNRISEHKFPDISKNENFMNIIELCNAIDISKKQNIVQIDSIKTIELNYDNEISSFIWLFKEDYPENEGLNEFDVIYINANSGKIYKTEKEYLSIEY